MDPWSRGRELAGGVPRYFPKSILFHSRRIEKSCHLFSANQRPIVFFHHTLGQRPPHTTDHCVNTVTLGWVGTLNERNPFRIHDAVVVLSIDVRRGLVQVLPLRTKRPPEFFWRRSWPSIGLRFFVFGVFQKFGTFGLKNRACIV